MSSGFPALPPKPALPSGCIPPTARCMTRSPIAPPGPLPAPDRAMTNGAQLAVGDLGFMVRHAPGHSPGSVCLVGPGVVLSGDVLFAGSIGRTDLPGGEL